MAAYSTSQPKQSRSIISASATLTISLTLLERINVIHSIYGSMLRTNNSIVNIRVARNRVKFDEAGPLFIPSPPLCLRANDFLALKMSMEQENKPPKTSEKEYRKTVVVGSASSWNAITLDLFGVTFNQHSYDELPGEVMHYFITEGYTKLADDKMMQNLSSVYTT